MKNYAEIMKPKDQESDDSLFFCLWDISLRNLVASYIKTTSTTINSTFVKVRRYFPKYRWGLSLLACFSMRILWMWQVSYLKRACILIFTTTHKHTHTRCIYTHKMWTGAALLSEDHVALDPAVQREASDRERRRCQECLQGSEGADGRGRGRDPRALCDLRKKAAQRLVSVRLDSILTWKTVQFWPSTFAKQSI